MIQSIQMFRSDELFYNFAHEHCAMQMNIKISDQSYE